MSISKVSIPINETVRSYGPGSLERASLKAELEAQLNREPLDIPCIIGGEENRSGETAPCRVPHDHTRVLARYHKAGAAEVRQAVDAAERARPSWAALPWEQRAAVFLKAADLLAGPWRDRLNAATMLGQSKTVFQAEIDAACELIDFWRFNVAYARRIMADQPPHSSPGTWNRLDTRPLDGFVFAVTPFNFTSIAGNLPTAPALMGNTCVWKPASSAVYSAHFLMRLLEEAGLPPGVINFVPGSGAQVGDPALASPRLGGIHFTGSTEVFQGMWARVGENIKAYGQYPRIVGETGGKDFIFAHSSARVPALITAMIRGAFEYQGQKCSAASRAYIPRSLWPEVRAGLERDLGAITMGDPMNFTHFMAAVIDAGAFETITEAINGARNSDKARVVLGGESDDSTGYFIHPTVVLAEDPRFDLMRREIFGPVLCVYAYDDERFEETLELCDATAEYALTGAVFAQDRSAVQRALDALRFAAGNFYINDKPTGAVVGQQPFGGSRASGTNDKAGSPLNLLRWVSPRTIKETFVPPEDFRYPYMDAE